MKFVVNLYNFDIDFIGLIELYFNLAGKVLMFKS
jgi:hypothetical protein